LKEGVVETFLGDARFGLRYLKKRPVFAVASILTLSLGIGMTTTMFTLVDSIILTPLPGSNTENVVYLERESESGEFTASPSPQLLRLIRDHASCFSRVEQYSREEFNVLIAGEPLRVSGSRASAGLFTFLGVQAARGRVFHRGDGKAGSMPTVVIDHSLWVDHFGQDPRVVGQTMTIADQVHEVIGVLEPEFRIDCRSEILFWIPAGIGGAVPTDGAPVEGALARLTPGVNVEAAQAELNAIIQNNPLDQVASMNLLGKVRTPEELMDPTLIRVILILQVAAVLVLLIGCGNLTNLLLAQGETRARELALRASLGARRTRLMRQLVVENLGLGLLGGIGGLLLTTWFLHVLPLFLPPGFSGYAVNRQSLLFATALSLLSILVVGVLPAWKGSRRNLNEIIKGDSPALDGAFRSVGTREVLVATEVAMAFVLLFAAGLLLKSFTSLSGMNLGFDRDDLVTFRLDLPESLYKGPEEQLAFYARLRERLAYALPPEIGSTTVSTGLVENLEAMIAPLAPEGEAPAPREQSKILLTRAVSPGHFAFLGIPILHGREFDEDDGQGEEKLIIINDRTAQQVFPGIDPTGRQLAIREDWYRVVGVSGSVNLPGLAQNNLSEHQVYYPFRQSVGSGLTVIARVRRNQDVAIDLIRQAIHEIDPALPIMGIAEVRDLVSNSLRQERSNSFLMTLFAASALALGVIGIYGVVAYSVSQRIREMGIRLVVGATHGQIVGEIVKGGMKTVLAGVLLGTLGALTLGSSLNRFLYEVNPRDVQVYILVSAGIAAMACIAAWLPARRVAGAEPLESLRSD
jgi:predicted permease